ncbi:MAG: hypothetical protein QM749_14410 [Aquabacterium sp.]
MHTAPRQALRPSARAVWRALARAGALAALIAVAGPAQAGKPRRDDPVRKDIVAAVRHHPAFDKFRGSKLDIRRIWASERFGYVCMLVVGKDGQHQGSDGAYDVHQIVLRHDDGKWTAVAQIEGLSESSKAVQCAADPSGQITDAFLEDVAGNPHLAL